MTENSYADGTVATVPEQILAPQTRGVLIEDDITRM